jgi:ribosomal-protein-alanine N-acetyltransferase
MQLKLMSTPKWLTNIADSKVNTLVVAEAYIGSKMTPQFEQLGFRNYVIVLKDTNVQMGCVGIYDRPTLKGYDFGFALLPAYEKQGYSYEESSCSLKTAKDKYGIKTLSAIAIPSNI